MLNVIMNAQQMEQFSKVFGPIENTHGVTTCFPMERFAEKHSVFKQSDDRKSPYVFELSAFVKMREDKFYVLFTVSTDFKFSSEQLEELEGLVYKEIIRVIGLSTTVSSFSEEEINDYLDDNFHFWADIAKSYEIVPLYSKKEDMVESHFREAHYARPMMMLNIAINASEEEVSIMTHDIDGTIAMVIDLFCNAGLPTDPEYLYAALELLEFSQDLYLVA